MTSAEIWEETTAAIAARLAHERIQQVMDAPSLSALESMETLLLTFDLHLPARQDLTAEQTLDVLRATSSAIKARREELMDALLTPATRR